MTMTDVPSEKLKKSRIVFKDIRLRVEGALK